MVNGEGYKKESRVVGIFKGENKKQQTVKQGFSRSNNGYLCIFSCEFCVDWISFFIVLSLNRAVQRAEFKQK